MAGLEHNIPLQVYLTRLELAEDEIVFQGMAADSAAVASLVSGLTDDGGCWDRVSCVIKSSRGRVLF